MSRKHPFIYAGVGKGEMGKIHRTVNGIYQLLKKGNKRIHEREPAEATALNMTQGRFLPTRRKPYERERCEKGFSEKVRNDSKGSIRCAEKREQSRSKKRF